MLHDARVPEIHAIAAFALLSFLLIIVPGPSVLFVVSQAVAHGRRHAVGTVVGNAAGFVVQIALVAVGLGAVVARSAEVFAAIKFVGAGYLVWLGVQTVRRRADLGSWEVDPGDARRSAVRDGFVVGVANPKSIVFFVAILPQFVDPDGAPAPVQMMLLGMVFTVIALVCDGAWGIAAGTARSWFVRSPRRMERLRAIGGTVIVGLGVRLAVSGRAD